MDIMYNLQKNKTPNAFNVDKHQNVSISFQNYSPIPAFVKEKL